MRFFSCFVEDKSTLATTFFIDYSHVSYKRVVAHVFNKVNVKKITYFL